MEKLDDWKHEVFIYSCEADWLNYNTHPGIPTLTHSLLWWLLSKNAKSINKILIYSFVTYFHTDNERCTRNQNKLGDSEPSLSRRYCFIFKVAIKTMLFSCWIWQHIQVLERTLRFVPSTGKPHRLFNTNSVFVPTPIHLNHPSTCLI